MIPQHTIDEIRDRAADDIVDIIEGYIPLKRSGNSYKAKCPFHDENTASFSVSPEKGIYKCFGCGEGGDGIDFIMKHEGLEFMDVIKHLARRYMIDISEGTGTKKRSNGRSNAEIYEAVLPGFTKMKAQIRKQRKVYFVFEPEQQKEMAESAAWLPVELPISRAQFKITAKYAREAILMGQQYDKKTLFQSVLNGIKNEMNIFIWAENGYKQDWLQYLLEYHPKDTGQIKNIIIQIPNEITYQIYQQSFIKHLNLTSKN